MSYVNCYDTTIMKKKATRTWTHIRSRIGQQDHAVRSFDPFCFDYPQSCFACATSFAIQSTSALCRTLSVSSGRTRLGTWAFVPTFVPLARSLSYAQATIDLPRSLFHYCSHIKAQHSGQRVRDTARWRSYISGASSYPGSIRPSQTLS